MRDFWVEMNGFDLPANNRQELDEVGFTIIPGPVLVDDLARLLATYDAAVSLRAAPRISPAHHGRTRIPDLAQRGVTWSAQSGHRTSDVRTQTKAR